MIQQNAQSITAHPCIQLQWIFQTDPEIFVIENRFYSEKGFIVEGHCRGGEGFDEERGWDVSPPSLDEHPGMGSRRIILFRA